METSVDVLERARVKTRRSKRTLPCSLSSSLWMIRSMSSSETRPTHAYTHGRKMSAVEPHHLRTR